jgi:predicted HAD superfamily Cof-like phosphohydrolase
MHKCPASHPFHTYDQRLYCLVCTPREEKKIVTKEAVHHPGHYGGADNPYEAIKVIEAWGAGFNTGNALKYICRAESKGAEEQDYKKACWYLLRELATKERRDPDFYNALVKAATKHPVLGDKIGSGEIPVGGAGANFDARQKAQGRSVELAACKGAYGTLERELVTLEKEVLKARAEAEDQARRAGELEDGLVKARAEAHREALMRKEIESDLGNRLENAKDSALVRAAEIVKRYYTDGDCVQAILNLGTDVVRIRPMRPGDGTFEYLKPPAVTAHDHLLDKRGVSLRGDQTPHQLRVERMMKGFGQEVPDRPTHQGPETRVLRARLIMEEALETIQDGLRVDVDLGWKGIAPDTGHPTGCRHDVLFDRLGFKAKEGDADLVELADGCADVSVVTIGTLSAFGIKDAPLLREVDANNQAKIDTGKTDEHGKFVKHPDHKPPKIAEVLQDQSGPRAPSMPRSPFITS